MKRWQFLENYSKQFQCYFQWLLGFTPTVNVLTSILGDQHSSKLLPYCIDALSNKESKLKNSYFALVLEVVFITWFTLLFLINKK